MNKPKMLPGWVLVRPLVKGKEGKIVFKDGTELFLDTSFNEHIGVNRLGIVESCCEAPNTENTSFIPDFQDIPVDSLVCYNWTSTTNAYDPAYMGGRVYEDCILVKYEQVFFYSKQQSKVSLSDITLLNGYCLGRGLNEQIKTSLFIPEIAKKKSGRVIEIMAVGKGNTLYTAKDRYGNDAYPADSDVEINVGDTVLLERDCDVPLEGEYNRLFPEKLFRFQRCNILGVFEGDASDVSVLKHKVVAPENVNRGLEEREYVNRQNEHGKKKFYY